MVHSHFAAFNCAQLVSLSNALRGRVWRLENGEMVEEEEDEKVEEDVYDKDMKKIETDRGYPI